MAPIGTLHIDIEGGWGGSSISLFELIKRLDRNRIAPIVLYRQAGPAAERYAKIGVPAYHVSDIASFVPRQQKALKNFMASLPRLWHLDRAARQITEIARQYDSRIVHLNYEGLFMLAGRLRATLALPIIAHSRAHLPVSPWGRWLVRQLAQNVDKMFFISPQEEARWAELATGKRVDGEVMWNIASDSLPRQPFANPPEIIFLGNIAHAKGPDRLIEIALKLRERGALHSKFAIYGRTRAEPDFEAWIRRRIASEGLSDWVELRGHVPDPAAVLARALILIRPSRDNDPWGRDVIEASAAGVPVLATGTFEGVVQSGINGFLVDPYDAGRFADHIITLRSDADRWTQLSVAGQMIARKRFGGAHQAEQFSRAVERLAS